MKRFRILVRKTIFAKTLHHDVFDSVLNMFEKVVQNCILKTARENR